MLKVLSIMFRRFRRESQELPSSLDVGMDTRLSDLDLAEMRSEVDLEAEQWLQELAMRDHGVGIKVAVFQRVKSGKGHLLAMLRMRDENSFLEIPPAEFAEDLVARYNQLAEKANRRKLAYAIWSSTGKPSDKRHSSATLVRAWS